RPNPGKRRIPAKPRKPKKRKKLRPMATRKPAAAAKPALKKPRKKTATQNRPAKRTKYLRAEQIFSRLQAAYPDARCPLDHSNTLQLLIENILSAKRQDKTIT